jgi:hypothetical protein
MKKTFRKLSLKRVTVANLSTAMGGYRCVSYEANCSNSCNTCDVNNWTCYVIDDTDFCDDNFSNGCPTAMPSLAC